jgi:hypothetical protein
MFEVHPSLRNKKSRIPGESRDPSPQPLDPAGWIPAFAGNAGRKNSLASREAGSLLIYLI